MDYRVARRFIKRPLEIEAFRYGFEVMPDWVGCPDIQLVDSIRESYALIRTPSGTIRANEGDYILKGFRGEFYIYAKEEFELSYDEVK